MFTASWALPIDASGTSSLVTTKSVSPAPNMLRTTALYKLIYSLEHPQSKCYYYCAHFAGEAEA